MIFKRILITGGAGFIGSNLAIRFKETFQDIKVTAFDNLLRRGSELNLPRFRKMGINFIHGDIRCSEDFEKTDTFDLLIDCSAEPSVHAGLSGSPLLLLQSNLVGTINCLEAARKKGSAFLYLSSSRVYPISFLNGLAFSENVSRFSWNEDLNIPGFSKEGINENAPLNGARSLYGASKLSGELLISEYVFSYRLPSIINRCGLIAGPWQMGKVDQGVVTLWAARHFFSQPLSYIGFGGEGKQVRDVLHVDDLFDLILSQINDISKWDGRFYNIGGGLKRSVSLAELTELCQQETGNKISISSVKETSPVDVRIYITDSQKAYNDFNWSPARSLEKIVSDVHIWIKENPEMARYIFNA